LENQVQRARQVLQKLAFWRSAVAEKEKASTVTKSKNVNKDPIEALFDRKYYFDSDPDAGNADLDPLKHYIRFGWREGRNPHPLFDVSWYLDQYDDVRRAEVEPLLHYLRYGWKEGRNPHPFFDTRWYLASYRAVLQPNQNPLIHFCTKGWAEGRRSAPFFAKLEPDQDDQLMSKADQGDWYAYVRTLSDIFSRVSQAKIGNQDLPIVGVITYPLRGTAYVRIREPLRKAEEHGVCKLKLIPYEKSEDKTVYSDCDVVVVQRFLPSVKTRAILRDLYETRKLKLAYETDDFLWPPRENSEHPADYSSESVNIKELLEYGALCSTITTSTEALKDELITGGFSADKIKVLPNRIDRDLWRITAPPKTDPKFRDFSCAYKLREDEMWFLYMGSRTHREDLEIVAPIFAELQSSKSVPRTPRLVLIGGANPKELSYPGIISLGIPSGRYPDFVRWLCSISTLFDAAVAPLVSSKLNFCKSNLKYLSYGALGLCGIYSDLEPYRRVVRHGRNGFLVGRNPEDWRKAIIRACNEPDEVSRVGRQAQRHVLRYFSYKKSDLDQLRIALAYALGREEGSFAAALALFCCSFGLT
jgi:glycosyltransferase involved in cell wall biosynthesis